MLVVCHLDFEITTVVILLNNRFTQQSRKCFLQQNLECRDRHVTFRNMTRPFTNHALSNRIVKRPWSPCYFCSRKLYKPNLTQLRLSVVPWLILGLKARLSEVTGDRYPSQVRGPSTVD